jgi:transketolase
VYQIFNLIDINNNLDNLARQISRWVLESTTTAGSGHPTSCLSAVEAVTALFFGGTFRSHLADPHYPTNDLFILSKGHAAPLLYATYAAAGVIDPAELSTLRRRGSQLEGHPTTRWPYATVATGSLGQGLAMGLGLAIDAKWRQLPRRIFVLLGDGEMMEGSNIEAMTLAAHEGLGNLIAAVDLNGLGQRGSTIWAKDANRWRHLGEAVGWRVLVARDGHNVKELAELWSEAAESDGRPTLLILPTQKGHGVSFLVDQPDRHGKSLTTEELSRALLELPLTGSAEVGQVATPPDYQKLTEVETRPAAWPIFEQGEMVATREAIGRSLAELAQTDNRVAVLDAEVANSTYFQEAMEAAGDRSLECYIAEQTMVGAAIGLSRAGRQPWLSTFAAFLTRAADQFRLAPYSQANLKIVGTHAGVSIGEDGPSQMGLEDIALFRSVGATVLYPADAVAAVAAVKLAAEEPGSVYLRATRGATPVIYAADTDWRVGGSHVLRQSPVDVAVVVAAGVTIHQALQAYDRAKNSGLALRIIDAYSVEPLDAATICAAARETGLLIVAEDHRPAGGLGEAVSMALARDGVGVKIIHLAVRNNPASATPAEQLHEAEIDADAIIKAVTQYLSNKGV